VRLKERLLSSSGRYLRMDGFSQVEKAERFRGCFVDALYTNLLDVLLTGQQLKFFVLHVYLREARRWLLS
jgi:hypothetical protein